MEELTFEFSQNPDVFKKGYYEYIKLFKGKRTLIFSCIFGLLSLLFLEQVIRQPNYGIGWLCLGVALFMAVSSFISPRIEAKKMSFAISEFKDERYSLTICEDKLVFKTVRSNLITAEDGEETKTVPETEIKLSDPTLVVRNCEDYLGIYSESLVYVISKSDVPNEAESAVAQLAENHNGKKAK